MTAELIEITLDDFIGIDLVSSPELIPKGKLRRAFGIDFSREIGSMRIRRGQTRLNATTLYPFRYHADSYTCPGDSDTVSQPAWKFTYEAGDQYRSCCTQPWEQDMLENVSPLRTGIIAGNYDWETLHGIENLPEGEDTSFNLGAVAYTTSGDATNAPNTEEAKPDGVTNTISPWRLTRAASDSDSSFCTQIWEEDILEGNTLRTGSSSGCFWFEIPSPFGITNIPGGNVDSQFVSLGRRYQKVKSQFHADSSLIQGGFDPDLPARFFAYRPLSDDITWTFIADRNLMRKYDGTNLRKWGIEAPSLKPIVAAGSATGLTGSYYARYTYVRKIGTLIAHESNPSPASDAVSLSDQKLSISAIVASDDPQVTHIRIYRTLANGSSYLYDQEIENGITTATSSTADSSLGSAVETNNNIPPLCNMATIHYDYIFLDGDRQNPGNLYYSKRFKPESFPPLQYLEMNHNDPGRALVAWSGVLVRFTRDTKYRILGSTASTFSAAESPTRRGILKGKAWAIAEQGIYFASQEGIFITNAVMDTEISEDIRTIFEGRTVASNPPVNVNGNHYMAIYRNKLYFAYSSGTSTEPDYLAVFDLRRKGWRIEPMTIRSIFLDNENNVLLRGGNDGLIYQMEQEVTDDAGETISIDVETSEVVGASSASYKRFDRTNVDANIVNESLTLSLLLDGSSVESKTLSAASRSLFRQRWNSGRLGMRGALRFQYTGKQDVRIGQIKIYARQMGVP